MEYASQPYEGGWSGYFFLFRLQSTIISRRGPMIAIKERIKVIVESSGKNLPIINVPPVQQMSFILKCLQNLITF